MFDSILGLVLRYTGCQFAVIGIREDGRYRSRAAKGFDRPDVTFNMPLDTYEWPMSRRLIIEDILLDDRLRGDPVLREMSARFFAGVALTVADNASGGVLLLADTKPRAAISDFLETINQFARVLEVLIETDAQAAKARELAETAEARERELRKKSRMLHQSERLAKIGTWEVDVKSNTVYFSDETHRIHETDPGSRIDLKKIRARMPRNYQELSQGLYDKIMQDGQGYDYVAEMVTARGTRRWMHSIIGADQHGGKVVRIFGTIRDVTAERMAEQALWRAANFDALTGAPNRYHWNMKIDEAFKNAIAHRHGLTIMIFDLDGFKEINDTRGHTVGDAVLLNVAERLGEAAPAGAFHARLGGDEFAVLVEDGVTPFDVGAAVRTLLAAIQRPIKIGALRLKVSGTFGCARFPADASTAADLMQKADIALYQAKRSHRASFVSFQPEIGGLFDDKRHAIELVASAIEQNRLIPFYQPKIDLKSGQVIGFEALCRVKTPSGSFLGPSRFLPALADPASCAQIGQAMLELVTADIAGLLAAGLDPGRVALNVAGPDFAGGDLDVRLLARLEAMRLPTCAIEIEVTENTIIGKAAAEVSRVLKSMGDNGVIVSLDDFGTGYASLTHLRDAPVKYIKLDRSFIAGLNLNAEHADSAIIVRAIVDLGHRLAMKIVAEGIETKAEADFLRAVGCDEAQGYLFGRPAPLASIRDSLDQTKRAGGVAEPPRKIAQRR